MRQSFPATPLEEDLCYLFRPRRPRLKSNLPSELHNKDFTKRTAALWSARDELTIVSQLWVDFDSHSSVSVKKQASALHKRLSADAMEWRAINGIFTSEVYTPKPDAVKSSSARALEISSRLSDDQWFFGVTGTIYLDSMTMTPPADKSIRSRDLQELDDDILPVYALPMPRDVDVSYRTALSKVGRELPTFEAWLGEQPYICRKWQSLARLVRSSAAKDRESKMQRGKPTTTATGSSLKTETTQRPHDQDVDQDMVDVVDETSSRRGQSTMNSSEATSVEQAEADIDTRTKSAYTNAASHFMEEVLNFAEHLIPKDSTAIIEYRNRGYKITVERVAE